MKKMIFGAVLASLMFACDGTTEETTTKETTTDVVDKEEESKVEAVILEIEKGAEVLEETADSLDGNIDDILKGL